MRTKTAKLILVFLASPGDVAKERKAAKEAIAWVSDHVAKPLGWRVEARTWERDVMPGTGKDAQSIINDQIGEMRGIDLFVLIMRDRFGMPTRRAGSGTEEEYDRAVAARKGQREPKRPHILLFFGQPSAKAESAQLKKVEAFKEKVGKNAMWVPFGSTADFERQFQDLLTKWTSARLAKAAKPVRPSAAAGATTARTALLLGERIYRVFRREKSDDATVATLEGVSAVEERALRTLYEEREETWCAYGLEGERVRVSKVERVDERGRSFVRVALSPSHSGYLGGYAGNLSEEERTQRARRMLLGIPLPKPSDPYGLVGRGDSVPAIVPPIILKRSDGAVRTTARLRAVVALLEAGIVTEIDRLTIGAPTTAGVKIAFEGRYRSPWGNQEETIRVSGTLKPAKANPADGEKKHGASSGDPKAKPRKRPAT